MDTVVEEITQNLNSHLFVYVPFKSMHEICYTLFTRNVTWILQVGFNDLEPVMNTDRYTNLKVPELSVSIAV